MSEYFYSMEFLLLQVSYDDYRYDYPFPVLAMCAAIADEENQ